MSHLLAGCSGRHCMHHDCRRGTVTQVFSWSLGVSSKRAAITVSVTSETAVGICSLPVRFSASSSFIVEEPLRDEPLLLSAGSPCWHIGVTHPTKSSDKVIRLWKSTHIQSYRGRNQAESVRPDIRSTDSQNIVMTNIKPVKC